MCFPFDYGTETRVMKNKYRQDLSYDDEVIEKMKVVGVSKGNGNKYLFY